MGASLPNKSPKKKRSANINGKVSAIATVTASPMQEIKEYELKLPSFLLKHKWEI